MVKTILWDFDGVILDSMKIKGDGFIELFEGYNDIKVRELEKYHYENGGVSRFEKIEYFFKELLNQKISEKEILDLAEKFALIIEKKIYNQSNLIEDTLVFIQNHSHMYNFHIVSGAEHKELNKICTYFNLDKFFLTINGSPRKKELLVKDLLEQYNYQREQTILIGDSITDYNAAYNNSIKFFGFNNNLLKQYGNYINTFQGLRFE